MVKMILISLQIIVAIGAVLSKNVPAGNDLKYIGSFRSRLSVQGRNTGLFDESNYYVSQNSGACNNAESDCKHLLNATLLAVETQEEWNYVRGMLDNYGFATDYWTSGEYVRSAAKSEWRWSSTDVALAPFAPWERGLPLNPNPAQRVLINYRNRNDATWSAASYTQLHRYICEVQAAVTVTPAVQPCYLTNDLVIVLDSSARMGRDNFEKAKQFVERLVSAYTVHRPNRVSLVTYSYFPTVSIDLDVSRSMSPAEISWTILNAEYQAGSTDTYLGIESATQQLISYHRGVPMNMVILYGGYSNAPHLTTDAVMVAAKWGIRTFSVRVTPFASDEPFELDLDAKRVYTAVNYENLINLMVPLSLNVCSYDDEQ